MKIADFSLRSLVHPSLLIMGCLWVLPLAAQDVSSDRVEQVRNNLRQQYNRIRDYQVDLTVSLRMPRLRMPRKRMTFTFKQPDMMHIEAKGFAMVPRRGVMLSPDSLFQDLQEGMVVEERQIDGRVCLVIRGVTPHEGEGMLVSELVVDTTRWVVREINAYFDGEELFHVVSEYGELEAGIFLPRETRLRFQLNERFLRGHRGPPMPSGARRMVRDPDEAGADIWNDDTPKRGEATIVFSNYRVNRGIPDDYFGIEEKNGKPTTP